jgi:hypothetical protein
VRPMVKNTEGRWNLARGGFVVAMVSTVSEVSDAAMDVVLVREDNVL